MIYLLNRNDNSKEIILLATNLKVLAHNNKNNDKCAFILIIYLFKVYPLKDFFYNLRNLLQISLILYL
jgi:hypothetical protein